MKSDHLHSHHRILVIGSNVNAVQEGNVATDKFFQATMTKYLQKQPSVVFLEISQNSEKITCARVSFSIKLQACNFIKKEILAQVFSCQFCEIFKDTLFTEHLRTTTSAFNPFLAIALSLYVLKTFCRNAFRNFLRKNLQKNTCAGVHFLIKLQTLS